MQFHKHALRAGLGLALLVPLALAATFEDDAPADVADVPSLDLRADDDENMRYFLIGVDLEKLAKKNKKKEHKLLLVLPGGSGSADFNAFCRRIHKNALSNDYVMAQLVAPIWSEDQARNHVWPTDKNPNKDMKFSTEEFLDAVLTDVESRVEIDPEHIYTMAWSSSGPAVYAWSVKKGTRATGHFISQAVFKPDGMPSLKGAKGVPYYLHQSPEDKTTAFRFAEEAKKALEKKGAEVKLVEYAGGHGWHGNVYGDMRAGVEWLESHHAKARKRPKSKKKKKKKR